MTDAYSRWYERHSPPGRTLAEQYSSADPIRYNGSLVYPMYSEEFGVPAVRIAMTALSAAPPAGLRGWGIGLSVLDGYVRFDGRKLGGIDVWGDALAAGLTVDLAGNSPGALFTLTPVWVDRDGTQKSWEGNYGILVEHLPDGRVTLWCSVGEGPPNFANLVVEIGTEAIDLAEPDIRRQEQDAQLLDDQFVTLPFRYRVAPPDSGRFIVDTFVEEGVYFPGSGDASDGGPGADASSGAARQAPETGLGAADGAPLAPGEPPAATGTGRQAPGPEPTGAGVPPQAPGRLGERAVSAGARTASDRDSPGSAPPQRPIPDRREAGGEAPQAGGADPAPGPGGPLPQREPNVGGTTGPSGAPPRLPTRGVPAAPAAAVRPPGHGSGEPQAPDEAVRPPGHESTRPPARDQTAARRPGHESAQPQAPDGAVPRPAHGGGETPVRDEVVRTPGESFRARGATAAQVRAADDSAPGMVSGGTDGHRAPSGQDGAVPRPEAGERADAAGDGASVSPFGAPANRDPGYRTALYNLGTAMFERGDRASAQSLWTQAAEAGHGVAAYYLGVLLLNNGDRDGAESWWRAAAERGEPRAAAEIAKLERWRNRQR